MRATRYYFRLIFALVSRFKTIFIASAILGITLFFIIRSNPTILGSDNVEKIGVSGRYTVDELPVEILNQIGFGLTIVNEEGIVEPGLAESWNTPDDGITWVFNLKDDVYWHDGKLITSSTINYEFSDAEIEKPDEKTIVFKLKNPFSPFPVVVSRPIFNRGLTGSGEWRVDKFFTSGSFVEKIELKNENNFKKIYKFYPTEEGAKLAFKLGQVDTLIDIFDPKPFEGWKTAQISSVENKNRYVAVFYNTEDKLLGEKAARQALSYAINKEQFPGSRVISPISENSWAYNSQVKNYEYRESHAKELLDELPSEVKGDLNINLATTPLLVDTAEKIVKDWEKIGVKTNVNVISVNPSEYQAVLTVVGIPLDPDQYTLWHSTQITTNISRYKNPRIDKLLEEGRAQLDLESRKSIYFDFQRFLLEDAPAAFLYHPVSYTVKRK